MIVGESRCMAHPLIPLSSPVSDRSGEADESEDSKSSMVITRLGCIGWSKAAGDEERSETVIESRGLRREKEIREVTAKKDDAKKGAQAMKRHAKRLSGQMDSRPSHDSAGQVITHIFIITCFVERE
jgi:hypothetical protein